MAKKSEPQAKNDMDEIFSHLDDSITGDSTPDQLAKIQRKVDNTVTQGLKPKHSLFVSNYILNNGNAAKAARDSGYTSTAAPNRLMDREDIQQAIKVRTAQLLHAKLIDRDLLVQMVMSTLEDLPHHMGARHYTLKAVELIAKLKGLTQPDAQINIQNNYGKPVEIEIVSGNQIEDQTDLQDNSDSNGK